MGDYSKMSDGDFEIYFNKIIADYYGDGVFDMIKDFPEIEGILREGLNGDVLDAWAEDNPDKAYPENYGTEGQR